MQELRFRESRLPSMRSGFRASRDASADSVIFTHESNFSLLISGSASVDCCSNASDAQDRDSISSEISLHLAGHDGEPHEISDIPDPDPNKPILYRLNKDREKYKAKVQKEHSTDDDIALDSARSSFSRALKECQDLRSRSEALKKLERRRPASLDLNNAVVSSPRLACIRKTSLTSRNICSFPSPGTPNYRHVSVGMQKGWSSERVPLYTNAERKNPGASMLPFNNGRMLPSKWEDAERWICSPVSGDGLVRSSIQQPHRRPKSKSGPLGVAYYSLYSPVVPMFEGGNIGNFMAVSPFSAGVIAADRLDIRPSGHDGSFSVRVEPCMARSASLHGCSKVQNQESLSAPEDKKHEEFKDAATSVWDSVSRRDMATQMSPDGSTHSSPKRGPSFTELPPSILPIGELQNGPSSKLEVRDVQVDGQVTMTRWSKKHRVLISGKSSEIINSWKNKDAGIQSPAWDFSDTTKSTSKVAREEARITAWENLQKAKAEAAIRKLEMKLEKKRSSSMDKIMTKLRSAQKRAQEMRSSVLGNHGHQVARTSHKVVPFRRTRQMGSLSGCFTCHAF